MSDDESTVQHRVTPAKKRNPDARRMTQLIKSRKQAYAEPSKDVLDKQAEAKKRLLEKKKKAELIQQHDAMSEEALNERRKEVRLIGELKAAEARSRIHILHLKYNANKGQDVRHLIASQPTAREAVRLEAFIPLRENEKCPDDLTYRKLERERVESLLMDTRGLLTRRT